MRSYPEADFSTWSRRQLIEHYFEKTQRLRWLYDDKAAHWAAVCVATSTARRETPYKLVMMLLVFYEAMSRVLWSVYFFKLLSQRGLYVLQMSGWS